jgi:hypothetical protein
MVHMVEHSLLDLPIALVMHEDWDIEYLMVVEGQ